jgi:hypothetical protein
MKIAGILLGALGAVVGVPASVQVQESGVKGDLQCFIANTQLQGSPDPQIRTIGMMGGMFFAGKIFGAVPDIDLEAALEKVAREVSTTTPQQTLQRCGKEMEQRGNQIQAVGRKLSAKGL